MTIEPSLLTPTSVLIGAFIGGAASLTAAIYSQWYQSRVQHLAREASKREAVYAEFIMSASKVQVRAYISDKLTFSADEQQLIGLVNRMRLFAQPKVIEEADGVIRSLIQISLQPSIDAQQLARNALSDRSAPDLLRAFSVASQADLEDIYRRGPRKRSRVHIGHALPSATPTLEGRSAPHLRIVSTTSGDLSSGANSIRAGVGV